MSAPCMGPIQGSRREELSRVSLLLGNSSRSLPPTSSVTRAICTALPSIYSTTQPGAG